MLMFKSEVKLNCGSPAICHILFNLSKVSDLNKIDLVVTSGNDSSHMVGSKHYMDLAVDVRSKHFDHHLKYKIWNDLRSRLGEKFFVDLENEGSPNEHFHIQVAKGKSFP